MSAPNLLVVDASTSLCSVALHYQGQSYAAVELQPRRQAQRLLPLVDELLTQAQADKQQLHGILYGRGPGSFTGIRIAASVVQGIALALDVPVLGFSSLQSVAAQVFAQDTSIQQVMVIMNAHMNEVFWGSFARGEDFCQVMSQEQVGSAEQCLAELAQFSGAVAGNALQLPEFAQVDGRFAELEPQAEPMLAWGLQQWQQQAFGDFSQHLPVYLRDSVAWKKLDEQPSLLKRD